MWRKRDGGYHKDGGSYHRDRGVTAAAKDHPNQSYKEGEPPNSRGGNSGRSGAANGVVGQVLDKTIARSISQQ